ncbi:MAG: phosphomannomutase [Ignavibacteriales bacterium]|jgi:phosphomannomutase|nr:phosphomannomutase [Ignavibacteriaceae bacterium]NLH60443.1 phosphomannomutase [Ignavibacteriales bacterium]HOJ19389.1 phosphomannomutase [Ignavibacteriaceae bacterium]
MKRINCFKAYDIRGKVPAELNEDLAYKIALGFTKLTGCKTVVVGNDIRSSSEAISGALIKGFLDVGVDVTDIGMCGTEMIYFGTSFLGVDGGIMITASHNPPEYNGMKFVKKNSVPISYDSGLNQIESFILKNELSHPAEKKGAVIKRDISAEFTQNLNRFYNPKNIKPLKVVVNAGNGCVGPALDKIEPVLSIEMVKLYFKPDSSFPNGVPNPMLEENRKPTIDKIIETGADLGVAWDGDYDRCFFFDETGRFIEGYYIVGLLAKSILKNNPGGKIVHDPRLTWNTLEIVKAAGGVAVVSKSGHAYIKEKMREVDSIYGGEMSAHHYFKENAVSDSGIIPFLLVLQLISEEGKSLSQLVGEMMKNYPCSGEINSVVNDPADKIEEISRIYSGGIHDHLDGLSVEYDSWRFNLRMSNTEPILRLNVESRGDEELMKSKTAELLKIIRG